MLKERKLFFALQPFKKTKKNKHHIPIIWFGLDIWLGCLLDASLWRCSSHVQLVGDPRADPEHARGTTYLFMAWECLRIP